MSDDLPVLYEVKEIARKFRISKQTVYREIWGGKLETVRIGKTALRVPEESISKWAGEANVMDEEFMLLNEAARALRISKSGVIRIIGNGEIKTCRINERCLRVIKRSFDEYVRGLFKR